MILKRFNGVDDCSKIQLLKKLKELADPALTFLVELEVKTKVRGRPSMKLDKSTRRDPSKFEYVESLQGNHHTHLISLNTASTQSNEKKK